MTTFALPRTAVSAHVRLTAGKPLTGEVYVMERVPQHTGPETPLEMLNRPEPFYAFRQVEGGPVLLVARAHTVMVSIAAEDTGEDPDRRSAAHTVRLKVHFAGGGDIAGFASVELPEQHQRLIDYLNASRDPFFSISEGDTVHFVNRAHVLHARPEE